MYSSRFFGGGIFPCGDVLAEEDPESFADEWLDEKQLGEECKQKVVTHKLNPVGKHSDNIKSLVVGIVQKCGYEAHRWAHQSYCCADNCCLEQYRMSQFFAASVLQILRQNLHF